MKFSASKRAVKRNGQSGMTLLEVMIALAIFSVFLAAVWNVLATMGTAIDLEEQRHDAAQNCRALLSQIRQFRDESLDPYPANIVAQFPPAVPIQQAGLTTLANENLQVTYGDLTASPVQVTVTSNWTNIRGGNGTVRVTTLMTRD